MSIPRDVAEHIKGRVSNRAYANVFVQPGNTPRWPAARVTGISTTPDVDICGDGGEDTADRRVQIDLAVTEAAGYDALELLKLDVMADMKTFDPPAIWDAERFQFDEPTRTHRCSLDYLIYPSSPEESP